MEKYYLFAEMLIGGRTISFISRHPIILNGCYDCGKYRGASQEKQGLWLDFFDDKFLCMDCLRKHSPPGSITKKLYIKVVDSGSLFPKRM
jgi:hypothetical protein